MTYIYREFGSYNKDGSIRGFVSSMHLTINKNNFFEILINGLHDLDNGVQAQMLVEYDKKCDLYDCIIKVLDVLSYDLHYDVVKKEPYHKDLIISIQNLTERSAELNRNLTEHSAELNEEYDNAPNEPWNIDTNIITNKCGSVWMHFTRENMKYVKKEDPDEYLCNPEDDYTVFRGKITENYEFEYDFPILNSSCSKKYYISTRGMKQKDL